MRITGVRAPVFLPPALPSAGLFPVEFVIASTGEPRGAGARSPTSWCGEAIKSGQFAFPPITDVRIDQAKAEIVFDRDKVASMGLSMQQVGADLATMLGGNFVNRFNIDGRSYKVIAAGRARRPAHARASSSEIHITGPDGDADAARRHRHACATGVEPRTLNRFQQLNAVKISGVAPRSLDGGLRVLEDRGREDPAAGLPRRLHRRVAAAAPGGRQVPAGDGAGASCSSSWCSRRSSTRSAIRSWSWPARCRWRCSAR